jgi:hypothetical protein
MYEVVRGVDDIRHVLDVLIADAVETAIDDLTADYDTQLEQKDDEIDELKQTIFELRSRINELE